MNRLVWKLQVINNVRIIVHVFSKNVNRFLFFKDGL